MASTLYVRPGDFGGKPASIRHPAIGNRAVPPEGCELPNDTITRKRIKEGGLVVGVAPAAAIEAPAVEAEAVDKAVAEFVAKAPSEPAQDMIAPSSLRHRRGSSE